MKFLKGILVGTAIATGVTMMYSERMINKKKIMKAGKQMAKKMGIYM